MGVGKELFMQIQTTFAKLNENDNWEPSTTRFYKRPNGSMAVYEFDSELEAIDKERATIMEMFGKEVKFNICSNVSPYAGVSKYSSRTSLPIDFITKGKTTNEIIEEIRKRGLLRDDDYLQISYF